MDYANAEDVALAYEGDLPAAWTARVDYLVRVVNARLTATIPALPGWVTGGQVDADLALDVVVRTVLRELRNPDGAVSRSQSLGEYSESATYGGRNAALPGGFDPQDLALLRPSAASSGPIRMKPWPELLRPCSPPL